MGIDGIKGPGSPPRIDPPDTGRATFDPSTGGAPPVQAGDGPSAALQKLQAGEIGIEEYLDSQVAGAVAHLEARLPTEQLEFVRETLREQLQQDPVLIELVRRTTGSSSE